MAESGRGLSRLRGTGPVFCTGATMQRSRAVFITGIIYALIGLVLAGGGIWLAALGGSLFYIILGIGILATAALLLLYHSPGRPECNSQGSRLAGTRSRLKCAAAASVILPHKSRASGWPP